MKALILAAMLLVCNPAFALSPSEIKDSYPLEHESLCRDVLSGDKGYCFMFGRGDGTVYIVFTQRGVPLYVRQTLIGGGYITVWERGKVDA